MNQSIWLALGLVLIIEGLGPMLWPERWRSMVTLLAAQPQTMLRRIGGALVVAGVVIYVMCSR
ncbi:DUF2065 domain-containing protein [Plesiomonas shigelloides]|uniref:DUF2065 domain-containing protein n=1 Tax=Plesiomonas shigelloides TaxID=703 RepID=UPI00126244E4|nr:DUF2065 domain-containing protein [Plesiomonas shigelloides]KAB7699653.1 DUF2065 family protein [Plesiomonas shigelloides]